MEHVGRKGRGECLGHETAREHLCVAGASRRCRAAGVTGGREQPLFMLSQTQWHLDTLPTLTSSNYFQARGAKPRSIKTRNPNGIPVTPQAARIYPGLKIWTSSQHPVWGFNRGTAEILLVCPHKMPQIFLYIVFFLLHLLLDMEKSSQ